MTAFVTGVAGFMGSHVAEYLVGAGQEVVGLDDLSGGFADNVPKDVVFHRGTILDQALPGEDLPGAQDRHRLPPGRVCRQEGLQSFSFCAFNYQNNVVGNA